jgi:hypothetical protein
VPGQPRRADIGEAAGQTPQEPQAAIHLPQQERPGVGSQGACVEAGQPSRRKWPSNSKLDCVHCVVAKRRFPLAQTSASTNVYARVGGRLPEAAWSIQAA